MIIPLAQTVIKLLHFSSGHIRRQYFPIPCSPKKDDVTDIWLMECHGIDVEHFHLKSPSNNPSPLPYQKHHSKTEAAWIPEPPVGGELPGQYMISNTYIELCSVAQLC